MKMNTPHIVSRPSLRLISPLVGMLATALLPAAAHATVYSWTSSSANWTTSTSNWSSTAGTLPDTSGTITVNNTGANYKVTVDADQTVAAMYNSSKPWQFAFSGGSVATPRTLTITGEMLINNTGAVSFYCATSSVGALSLGSINMTAAGTLSLGRNTTTSSLDQIQSLNVGGVSMTTGSISLNVSGAASLGLVNFTGNGATRTLTLVSNYRDAQAARAVTVAGIDDAGKTAGTATILGSAGSTSTTGVATPVTLTIANTLDYSSGASIQDGSNGVLSVTKSGAGAQTLAGTLSYTGVTKIDGGKLNINGNASGVTGDVQVNSGATLGGSGIVGTSTSNVSVNNGTIDGNGLTLAGQTTFHGASTLAGNVNTTQVTVAAGGNLTVTGTTSGTVAVNGAALNGTGRTGAVVLTGGTLNGTLSTGVISGTGLVSPGNSPGILTATSVTVSDGLNFAVELQQATPDYSNALLSHNDVLHLTGAVPFSTALGAGNTISIFLASANIGSSFQGGFLADNLTANILKDAVKDANFVFYVLDTDGNTTGDIEFNHNYYNTFDSRYVNISTAAITDVPFATGSVSGSVLEFTVVPEPATWALMVGGLGVLALRRRKAWLA